MPIDWRDCTLTDLAAIGARRPRIGAGDPQPALAPPRVAPREGVRKYRNHIVYLGQDRFDSRHEADEWLKLCEAARRGQITNLQRQVPFDLRGQSGAVVARYFADFVFERDGVRIIADAKGVRTKEFKIKQRWMHFDHGIDIVLL